MMNKFLLNGVVIDHVKEGSIRLKNNRTAKIKTITVEEKRTSEFKIANVYVIDFYERDWDEIPSKSLLGADVLVVGCFNCNMLKDPTVRFVGERLVVNRFGKE